MKTYAIVDSEPLQNKLCEIMGIDPGLVASMTIKLRPSQPVFVEVTLLAEEKMLLYDFSGFSKAIEIGQAGKQG
jgi:hypothetical protein